MAVNIKEEMGTRSLVAFMDQYKAHTSADIQTFTLGWNAGYEDADTIGDKALSLQRDYHKELLAQRFKRADVLNVLKDFLAYCWKKEIKPTQDEAEKWFNVQHPNEYFNDSLSSAGGISS